MAANPELHYLDSAATSQKPSVVLDAMRYYYEHDNANPHRGAYALSARATERYHEARERIARFIGVRDTARVIFTRGTTESLNLVAAAWGRANLGPGDDIVVTALEHHANFVPWQQVAIERDAALRICRITPDGRIDLEHLAALVSLRTKVVAFNHVSNALGTINPVEAIAAIARDGSERWSSATGHKLLRIFRSTSTRSTSTSTPSAGTRCSAPWASAYSSASVRSSNGCRRIRRAAT